MHDSLIAQTMPKYSNRAIRSRPICQFIVATIWIQTNCLSLDPDFVTSNFTGAETGSDNSPIFGEDSSIITDTTNTEHSTSGSGSETITSTGTHSGSSDSESTTSEGTIGGDSTTSMDLNTGTSDSTNTSDTTDSSSSADTTDVTDSTASNDTTSGDSTGTAPTDTTSTNTTSTDTSSTSEDTGSEPCTPSLCMVSNSNASVSDTPWALGSNIYATLLEPDSTLYITRAEIVSGEVSGILNLEIWSNDSGTQRPHRLLDGDNTALQLPVSWQGVDFSSYLQIDAGERYWLVWSLPNNAQAPLAQSGQLVRSAWSANNGAQWNIDNSPIIYRIYCCDSPN